jgi:hypothetical protein
MKAIFKFCIIYLIALIVVLLIPYGYHLDLGPGPDGIEAFIWEIYGIGDTVVVRIKSSSRLYLGYCAFRIIALLVIIIYYHSKLKKIFVLLAGVITELIPFSLSMYSLSNLNDQGENLLPIIFPFPILLLYIIILIAFFPREKIKPSTMNELQQII